MTARWFSWTIAFSVLAVSSSADIATADERESIATDLEVPFFTIRNVTGDADPKDYFGDARGSLSSGWCELRNIGINALTPLSEAAPFRIPDEFLRVTGIQEAERQEIYDAIGAGSVDRAPLIYTHGFNIGFEKGCRRASVLQSNAKLNEKFVWFSWPSDGLPTNYTQDETDLYWSAPDLADLISDMSTAFAPERLNLAGHSLGGRGVALTLYILENHYPDIYLNNVVLLAPDMDFGMFERILPNIRERAKRITIYVTDNDRALQMSEKLHGLPRLGQSGNAVDRLGDVEVIDVSGLPADSASGHLYHIYGELVGRDLDQLLNADIGAADREALTSAGPNLWYLTDDN